MKFTAIVVVCAGSVSFLVGYLFGFEYFALAWVVSALFAAGVAIRVSRGRL